MVSPLVVLEARDRLFCPALGGRPGLTLSVDQQPPAPVDDTSLELAEQLARISAQLLFEPDETGTLRRIVELARNTVAACDYCGVSLRGPRRSTNMAASTSSVVDDVEALQYDLQEGPALDSIWVDEMCLVDDLAAEERWPRWAPQAAALGIGSFLSVRLATSSTTLGGLTLYSRQTRAFSGTDIHLARVFGTHAAAALSTAREVAGLTNALATRHLIGVAQGILMSRYGLSVDRAFAVLSRESQQTNTKLHDVARRVVDLGALPSHEDQSQAG
jgi:GAF domain-containing protein